MFKSLSRWVLRREIAEYEAQLGLSNWAQRLLKAKNEFAKERVDHLSGVCDQLHVDLEEARQDSAADSGELEVYKSEVLAVIEHETVEPDVHPAVAARQLVGQLMMSVDELTIRLRRTRMVLRDLYRHPMGLADNYDIDTACQAIFKEAEPTEPKWRYKCSNDIVATSTETRHYVPKAD